ncbi:NADH:flavin oxidoreductase/NADH oxidase family protein [Pseudonocardiaceae bacterium YIM PH 21723]|nr:NADH:flavin oxidoreductase/NADH oxidase family protein [Pseudonocardiaceae bacterium YIM PH 21723]
MTGLLGSPFALPCGVSLKNRLAKSALSEGLGDKHNAPTERLQRLYERWSDSGAGLIITGNVMVAEGGIGEPGNVVVTDYRHQSGLKDWAVSAGAGGAEVWVQINHAGRQAMRHVVAHPVAPSEVQLKVGGSFAKPRALTEAEIEELIEQYATTAKVVVESGFGGVQIHGAHGYLVSQFLSPRTNKRTDRWGGTPENRSRFLLEVFKAMRAAIGPETPLSVKLNSADFQRGGITEEDTLDVVLALHEAGVDLLEVSGGTYESAAMMGMPNGKPVKESTRQREAYFLEFAEKVRSEAPTLPLMVTGGFRSRAAMQDALDNGSLDLVGLGRPLAVEPDFPQRLLDGADGPKANLRPRTVGLKMIDSAAELTYYTTQMWRMGDGKEPKDDANPLLTFARYTAGSGIQAFRRQRRGH